MSLVKYEKKIPQGKILSDVSTEDLRPYLPKGKYDIHYVITLLRMIDSKCQSRPMSDLGFTLSNSLRRLISHLEVERDQPKEHIVHLACSLCDHVESVFTSKAKDWQCPVCSLDLR